MILTSLCYFLSVLPWRRHKHEHPVLCFSCMILCLLLQDVAVKVFSKQEYSDDAILSFRQEVVILVLEVRFPSWWCWADEFLLHVSVISSDFSSNPFMLGVNSLV